ncbi:M1 family aminopeptidase [Spirosoma arcticum]
MKFLYLCFVLLPLWANAQLDTDGGQLCQEGKVRAMGRLAANPRARLAYTGDTTIDVTYYGLDLRLTHTPNYLRGAATIALKSRVANLNAFFLDVKPQLTVDSVTSAGQRLTFVRITDRVSITPPQPLSTGQALTLTVHYQGNPASQSGFGSFAFSTHGPANAPVIWSLSEPYGASDWFPCKDSPADKADSSAVSITAPAQFVSVSNGVLVSTTGNLNSRTYQWRNSYPIAHYLISVAMSNYEQYDTPFAYGGRTMPVTHYVYPETLPGIRANLDRTTDMLRIFSDRFGPYPFLREKYGHAQFGWGGGMEHQTISSMGAWSTGLIAHELAHQWFGDKITCRDWQNIWLNEGFASYAEAVYNEAANGPAGYTITMSGFLNRARNARGSLYVQDISNVNTIFNSDRTYAKGATVLHMLRGVVGDSTFFRILRAYTASPAVAYGTAVTEDFQAVAQQVSGQDLSNFFRQWIYGEGYPTYRTSVTGGASANTATVRLEQRNTVASNPTSFTMPVQIRVQSATGDTTVTVLNDRADQTFTLPTRGPVTGVVVDPDNRILKTVESTTLVVTAVAEPVQRSLRVYPNPATDALTVDFTTAKTGSTTLQLTNLTGQRVRTLGERSLAPGSHTRTFNLHGLPAGHYTLTVQTPDESQSRVVLVR